MVFNRGMNNESEWDTCPWCGDECNPERMDWRDGNLVCGECVKDFDWESE